MLRKNLFLFAFTFLTHLFCNAQINLQGCVKDLTTQEKIEFAHIAVQNASDTTKILYSAITNGTRFIKKYLWSKRRLNVGQTDNQPG